MKPQNEISNQYLDLWIPSGLWMNYLVESPKCGACGRNSLSLAAISQNTSKFFIIYVHTSVRFAMVAHQKSTNKRPNSDKRQPTFLGKRSEFRVLFYFLQYYLFHSPSTALYKRTIARNSTTKNFERLRVTEYSLRDFQFVLRYVERVVR